MQSDDGFSKAAEASTNAESFSVRIRRAASASAEGRLSGASTATKWRLPVANTATATFQA